jgi:hypothetical protein
MGGEGSGRKPSKPKFLVGQRDLFGSLLKHDSEPPQKQQRLGASTSQTEPTSGQCSTLDAEQVDDANPAANPDMIVVEEAEPDVEAPAGKQRNSVVVRPA